MEKKRIFILSGPAGAGKTTWVKKQIVEHGGIHVSRDEIRFSMVSEDDDYFAHENEVFKEWIRQCQEAIDGNIHNDIYIDATHISDRSRAKTMNNLKIDWDNMMLICVRFIVPIDLAKYRNSLRKGRTKVPNDVIESMYRNYSYPSKRYGWAPKFDEIWEINSEGERIN